jgi:transmembrane protein TMEM260 (protein O-mannosyltransferase)
VWTPSAHSWRKNAAANVADADVQGSPRGPSQREGPPEGGHDILFIAAACLVATIAFWAYTRTLLPGVDLGDTGGFQAAVLWPENSARRAYPLYYTLAAPFIRAASADHPARGLNLFSAIWAAIAVGLLTFFSGRLTKSPLAGAAAGLLLAFSFTFWTQAIIAEVYSLHLALVAACLLALSAFAARQTRLRLAIFFALYAAAFGNHLGMILFLVPFTVFLLQVHPRPHKLFTPSTILLALAIAAAGALQYARTFMYVWSSIDAPSGWVDRIAAFWLDVTKADWREEMVLGVSSSQLWARLEMWAWDARQQFGIAGLTLAAVGAIRVWSLSKPWAVCVWLAYAITTAFALTYNVGDTHVFLLPGHFLMALAIAAALGGWRSARLKYTLASVALVYAGWRGWDTWPAVDRHTDHRAEAQLAHLAQGVNARTALLVSKMDWQVENVLLYSSRYERRDLAWVRLDDVLLHFPFLVRDNLAASRDLVLTADAAAGLVSAYANEFPLVLDQPPASSLSDVVSRIPRGTPYVLTLLLPAPGGRTIDREDFARALAELTGNRLPGRSEASYEVWAGSLGEAPSLYRSSAHPFRQNVLIGGEPFTIRMDSWLPEDTFRRSGFAHVLHGREHALIAERGISLVWLQRDGSPATYYGAGLYTPEARFRILATAAHLARNQ